MGRFSGRFQMRNKEGTFFGAVLSSKITDARYLLDWDDGSTSTVVIHENCSSQAFGDEVIKFGRFAIFKELEESSEVVPPLEDVDICIFVEIPILPAIQPPKWYNSTNPEHRNTRLGIGVASFDIVLQRMKLNFVLNKHNSEDTRKHNKDVNQQSKPGNHHQPTAAESAIRWEASEANRCSRIASSTITSPCHTAAFIERYVLENSHTFEDFRNKSCSVVLKNYINSHELFHLLDGDKGEAANEALLASVLRFMKWHGDLEGCRYEEDGCWWRISRCAMDDDTKQKGVYYYLDTEQNRKFVNGDQHEFSSLKEVWAWVMRSTARHIQLDHQPSFSDNTEEEHLVDEAFETQCGGFTRTELLKLADLIEHTPLCDLILSGTIEEDIPHHVTTSTIESIHRVLEMKNRKYDGSNPKEEDERLQLLQEEKILLDAMLTALNSIDIPFNQTRLNVRQHPDQRLEAMCMGAVSCRASGVQYSVHTRDRPNLTKLLVQFGLFYLASSQIDADVNLHSPSILKNFTFSSIQVNKNYASAMHVDGNNFGPSLIIGLGDYHGGSLWTLDHGPLDIKNKWAVFDGNVPHGTLCFSGVRYSLTFFTIKNHTEILPYHRNKLEKLGFPLPPLPSSICLAQRRTNKRGLKDESAEQGRKNNDISKACLLSKADAEFRNWLKGIKKPSNKGTKLRCGAHCGAHVAGFRSQQYMSMLLFAQTIQKEKKKNGTDSWLSSLFVGSLVEAQYLNGTKYHKGKILQIHDNVVDEEVVTQPPRRQFDILFEDGDTEYFVKEHQLREYCIHRKPAISNISSSSPLISTSATESAIQVARDQAEQVIASARLSNLLTPQTKSHEQNRRAFSTLVESDHSCPLLVSLKGETVDENLGWNAHVDQSLKIISKRFPVGVKFLDLEQSTPHRVVVGYFLQNSEINVIGEDEYKENGQSWLLRTSPVRGVHSPKASNSVETEEVLYQCSTGRERAKLDHMMNLMVQDDPSDVKEEEVAPVSERCHAKQGDVIERQLLDRYPPGTLLFDFDEDTCELRMVLGVIWSVHEEEEASSKGRQLIDKETEPGMVDQSLESTPKASLARGWYSLVTVLIDPLMSVPASLISLHNQLDKPKKMKVLQSNGCWKVGREKVDNDMIELYLADTTYQREDLDNMTQIAGTSLGRWLDRSLTQSQNRAKWARNVREAVIAGRTIQRNNLMERFSIMNDFVEAADRIQDQQLKRKSEDGRRTLIFDQTLGEVRRLSGCAWYHATHHTLSPKPYGDYSPCLRWGGRRNAGGAVDGGWVFLTVLHQETTSPPRRTAAQRADHLITHHTASIVGTLVLYPVHTIDDQRFVDEMLHEYRKRSNYRPPRSVRKQQKRGDFNDEHSEPVTEEIIPSLLSCEHCNLKNLGCSYTTGKPSCDRCKSLGIECIKRFKQYF